MNYLKSIFLLSILVVFTGIFSAQAQKLSEVRVPQEVKAVVINHLKAATKTHKGLTANKAVKDLSSKTLSGFNIGMPPTKNIIIIIFESSQVIRQADRFPSDALKISAELGAGLKKQGISPERSMAFQVNTTTLKVEKFSGPSGTGKMRK
jgi:hypothetical protein